jgi:RNA polymerase sigma-70 factor (ECF subfamily)
MLRELSDDALVERVLKGGELRDAAAYKELMERYQEKVMANCRYLSGSAMDAEDLAQEVFVKAYFGLASFEGRSQFGTWLRRVKTNHCLNFVKRRKKAEVSVDDVAPDASDALVVQPRGEQNAVWDDERRRIDAALEVMTETLRVPLVLRDMDEFSYQEIAEQLGVGLSAVKMRIKRGREEFRRIYEALDAA